MSAIEQIMYGDLTRMRHVWRFSAQPVLYRENVAEHSFWTALIAMTIAAELHEYELVGEVAQRAILHDVEETLTGDLVREMKYFDAETRQAIGRVEALFADRLFGSLPEPVGPLFQSTWEDAKDPSLAGRIVAMADLLCVLSYLDHERSLGNQSAQLAQVDHDCRTLIDTKFAEDDRLYEIAAAFGNEKIASTGKEGTD